MRKYSYINCEYLIFLFTTASKMALGPTLPPIQWVPGALSLGIKRPGREADHSPQSSTEVKEWVELHLHSPNTPSWRGAQLKHRDNFTFTFCLCRNLIILESLWTKFVIKIENTPLSKFVFKYVTLVLMHKAFLSSSKGLQMWLSSLTIFRCQMIKARRLTNRCHFCFWT
jgi:hypothetical protein